MQNISLGYLYFTITALAFGSFEVVSKVSQIAGIDGIQINFVKHFIAFFFLLPFVYKRINFHKLKIKTHISFIFLSILLVTSTTMLIYSISELQSAALAGLIFCSNPVFTIFFGVILTSEKFNGKLIPSLGLGILGIIVISLHKLNPHNLSFSASGLLLVVTSAILFSLYGVCGKIVNQRTNKHTALLFTMFWSAVILGLYMFATNRAFFIPQMLEPPALMSLIWNGAFISGIGYLAYFAGMEKAGVQRSMVVFFLKPLLASILAIIIVQESITWNMYVGTFIVLLSLYILTQTEKKLKSVNLEKEKL